MTWTDEDSEKARLSDLLTLDACRKLLLRAEAEIERLKDYLAQVTKACQDKNAQIEEQIDEIERLRALIADKALEE